MCRLSGDQNGKAAPSVPATGRDSTLSSVRTHSTVDVKYGATNASVRPSGDNARLAPCPGLLMGGVGTSKRISGRGSLVRRDRERVMPAASPAPVATAAADQRSQRDRTGAGAVLERRASA